jgi:eukaryotic-like serine/threonine-protein kinase
MVEAPVTGNAAFDENGEPVTQPGLAAPKPAPPPPPERLPPMRPPPPPAMAPAPVPSMRMPAAAAPAMANGSQDRLPRIVREAPPPDMLINRPAPSTGMPIRPPMQPVREVSRPLPPPPEPREEPTDRSQLAGGRQWMLLGGGSLLLALLIALALFIFKQPSPPPMGYLYLDVPAELRDKVKVKVNEEVLTGRQDWPLLRQVPAGQVAVLVSAEGYEPFAQVLQIGADQRDPPKVNAVLKPLARTLQMVFVTDPEDAALKLDNTPVRDQGTSNAHVVNLPMGKEVLVEASAPGYKPLSRRVPVGEGKPTTVTLSLEPALLKAKVESEPSGASILVDDKQQGTTPGTVELSPSVKQVVLQLKCYEEAVVELKPDAAGALPKVTLKKQKNCR